MLPYTNPEALLHLHHERAGELRREAAAYRLARNFAPAGRHRRFGRAARTAQAVRAPAVP